MGEERCVSHRDASALVVNCRECDGACDLGSIECLNSIIVILAIEDGVESIHLKGELDIHYEGEAVNLLNELAEIFRICKGHRRPMEERICADCPCQPGTLFEALAASIAMAPVHRVRERLLSMPSKGNGCDGCKQRSLVSLRDVETQLTLLTERINEIAFHVVEGDVDA